MKTLSVVIPCYNEEKNLPKLVSRCAEKLTRPDIEVIFVDNGSTDNTSYVLKNLLSQYPNGRSVKVDINLGYGHGILTGLSQAEGNILAWTHADLQTDPADVLKGLDIIEKNTSKNILIKGKRFGRTAKDVFFTWGMSVFETILLGKILWDINAQPNLFHRNFFETWKDAPFDASFDLYVFYLAKKQGKMIKRFSVNFGKRLAGEGYNESFKNKIRYTIKILGISLKLRKNLNKIYV